MLITHVTIFKKRRLTMRNKLMIAVVVGLAVFGWIYAVSAEDTKAKTNQSEEKGKVTPEAQAAADLALAAQLAEYGRRTNNPMVMISAAQIMKNTPSQDKKQEKTTEGAAVPKTEKKSGALETPEKLLADAQALAKKQNNEAVAAMAEKESKILGQKGREGGPSQHVDRIYPGVTDVYDLTFRGDEMARVVVIGDGDCDLDVRVYDENGNFIVGDTDPTDRCLVEWEPAWTGMFKIRIKNNCSVYADYLLLTN